MNDKKDKRAIGALIIGACVGLVLGVILIALRTSGLIDMHWALVLTGFSWLTWLVYALMGLAALLVYRGMKVWRWWRLRNCREVRINAEDLRLPGETDEQLRARIYRLVADFAVPGLSNCTKMKVALQKPIFKQIGNDEMLCCPICGEPVKLWARDLTKPACCLVCGLSLDLSEYSEEPDEEAET